MAMYIVYFSEYFLGDCHVIKDRAKVYETQTLRQVEEIFEASSRIGSCDGITGELIDRRLIHSYLEARKSALSKQGKPIYDATECENSAIKHTHYAET